MAFVCVVFWGQNVELEVSTKTMCLLRNHHMHLLKNYNNIQLQLSDSFLKRKKKKGET